MAGELHRYGITRLNSGIIWGPMAELSGKTTEKTGTQCACCADPVNGALTGRKSFTHGFLGVIITIVFTLAIGGCGDKGKADAGINFTFVKAVPLVIDGLELSTPLLIPDEEYGGVYIAAKNTNVIFRYDPVRGIEKYIEPAVIPQDANGVGAFCYADGDFFFRPATGDDYRKKPANILYQLTAGGRIRYQDLPPEVMEDVQDFGILVYLGDGRVLIETHPKGPFAIVDFVANEVERTPASFPERGAVTALVPDYGAREVYLQRRATDMSVYFLRFPFKGAYRGVKYISGRMFFAAAATVEDLHLMQYASGEIHTYDFMYKQVAECDLAKMTETKYSLMLGMTVVDNMAYLVGIKGSVTNPDGYDLLIFGLQEPTEPG